MDLKTQYYKKFIYTFNIPIKMPADFVCVCVELDKLILNWTWKCTQQGIATILKNNKLS